MKQRNRKIKYIILKWLLLFIFFVLILLYIIQILSLNTYYEKYKTRQLEKISKTIKNTSDISNTKLEDLAYENGICVSVYDEGNNKNISTMFNKGCIFSDKKSINRYINKFLKEEKDEETILIKNNRFKKKTMIKAIKYDENTYIFLSTSIEPLDSTIVLLKRQYFQAVLLLVLISIIVGIIISKELSKPIEKLNKTANELSKGNFNIKFSTNSNIEEINELSNTLEKVKIELSKTDELRRDLMANVGHDLKTPLTMIKAYAEMSRDLDNQSVSKKKENMNIIIDETERLNILVRDILNLSKLQHNIDELKLEKFDINEVIRNVLQKYYILIDNEGYEFIYNIMDNRKINVYSDKKRIEQVIYNLINNAINYTGKDKKVYVNLVEDSKKIRIEIKDTGKGIDKNEYKVIWDKYYHNEKKHKRNTIGTGLGLSIVKSILEKHNYNYGVFSKKGKGTTFYFEIDKC